MKTKLQQEQLGVKSLKDKGVVCLGSGILWPSTKKVFIWRKFVDALLIVCYVSIRHKLKWRSISTPPRLCSALHCKRRKNTQERKCRYFSNLITSIYIYIFMVEFDQESEQRTHRRENAGTSLISPRRSIYIFMVGFDQESRTPNLEWTQSPLSLILIYFFEKTQIKTITMKTEMRSSSPIFES